LAAWATEDALFLTAIGFRTDNTMIVLTVSIAGSEDKASRWAGRKDLVSLRDHLWLDGKRSNRRPVLGGVSSTSKAEQGTLEHPWARSRSKLSMTKKKQLSEGRNKSALARVLGRIPREPVLHPRMKEKDWRLKGLPGRRAADPSSYPPATATALDLPQAGAEGHASVWHHALPQERQKMEKSKVSRYIPTFPSPVMPAYANTSGQRTSPSCAHGKKVYVATVIDLYTRRILGIHVA